MQETPQQYTQRILGNLNAPPNVAENAPLRVGRPDWTA
jgi:hypothetical protein